MSDTSPRITLRITPHLVNAAIASRAAAPAPTRGLGPAPHPGPGPHPAPRPGPRLPTCRTGHVRAPAPRATGFVLASLAGAVGLGLAIALWVAGAPAVLILAAYLVTPGLALGLIGLCTARIPSRYRREYRRPDFNGCDANV